MLNFKIDTNTFESLNDVEKTFYAQAGDGYQLQVDGAVDKSKLDEFRANNVELMKKADQYKDVDMDKYNAVMEKERALRNKELIDKGEFDTLLAEHTKAMQSDYEAKMSTLNEQLSGTSEKYNNLVTKYEIEGAAAKAFAEHKIRPEAHEAIMAQIKTKFSIDNGQVIARNGDAIEVGADGNLTVSEFVASQPEIFRIPSEGGVAKGGQQHSQGKQFANSRARIADGLKSRMG